MFFTPALAADAGASAGGGLASFVPIILIFVIFYFLLIRPQQKKMKQHQEMVSAVQKGDEVITGGGIYGKVTKVVDEHYAMIQISPESEIKVLKSTLSDVVRKKGEKVKKDDGDQKKK